MGELLKTMSVGELEDRLKTMPKDAKIFLSRDEEGNGYGTLSDQSWEYQPEDNCVIFYPFQEGLEYEDIMPKSWAVFEKETDGLTTKEILDKAERGEL